MKNKNLDNLIKNIKKISLTNEERSTLFAKLDKYTNSHHAVKSPLNIFVWPSNYISRSLSYVLASLLVFVLIGGSTVFASGKSLPGDVLYPIKIHVLEPLKVATAITAEAKDRVKLEQIGERFKEAETLAIQGRLGTTTSIKIKDAIKNQTDSLKDKISDKNKNNIDIEIYAHSIILKSIQSHASPSQKENIENIESITNQNQENNKEDITNSQSFDERKNIIEKVIKNTNKKIKENIKEDDNTVEYDILNNASSSIKNAQDDLDEALENHSKNNRVKADTLIRESENKAKGASISVDRGLEFRKIKDR